MAAANRVHRTPGQGRQTVLRLVEWNAMHFRTHVKAENGKSGQDEYSDGMVEYDAHVGVLLKVIDDLGLANDTIVMYSTDNGPHYNTWPDAGTTLPWREEFKLGRRLSCAGLRALARTLPRRHDAQRIVAHEDWLPTFAAAASAPDIKEKLLNGVDINGRHYRKPMSMAITNSTTWAARSRNRLATNSGT